MKIIDQYKNKINLYLDKIKSVPSISYFVKKINNIRLPKKYTELNFLKIIIIAYLSIMLPITGYCIYKTRKEIKIAEKKEAGESDEFMPMVKAFKIKRDNYNDILLANGTVKGASEVELKFEISGKISSFNFREGNSVAMGEIIASLDSEDVMTRLRHSKSKLETIEARYAAAKEKIKVYRELYQMGAIIESKLKEMELSADSLKSEIEASKSEVQLAQSQLDKTVIASLVDGVMGIRQVEVGDFVTPNDIVGTFLEVKNVFVEMGVIEKDIEKVGLSQKVKVTVDAYPDELFWGTVDNISQMVRGETRTLPVKVKISNPGRKLLSGMYANCEVFLAEFNNIIVVPSSSIIDVQEMKVSPLIKPIDEKTGVIELRKVEIGYASSYTIIKEGLEEGDIVVMETQQSLRDGMKVKVVEVIESNLND
jgi:membrane fusion protein (multidrug efflux system)